MLLTFGFSELSELESHQWRPSHGSAPPHKNLIFIKFSIFMSTGALFWVYLECLVPLGSSALFFSSQLFGVHTFPISIPLETVSSFEMVEVFLGKLQTSFLTLIVKVQLKIWSQLFSLIRELSSLRTFFSQRRLWGLLLRPQWSAFLWGKMQFPSSIWDIIPHSYLTRDAKSQGSLKAGQQTYFF